MSIRNAAVILLSSTALLLSACGPKHASSPIPRASTIPIPDSMAMETIGYEIPYTNGAHGDSVDTDTLFAVALTDTLVEEIVLSEEADTTIGLTPDSIFSQSNRRYQSAFGLIREARMQIDTALALLDTIPPDADPTAIVNRDQMLVDFSRLLLQLGMAEQRNGRSKNNEFPIEMNKFVEKEIRSFQRRERRWFKIWIRRSGMYLPMLKKMMRDEGMPEQLAYLPVIESGFSNRALSKARALGMWQFMYTTGKGYGLKRDQWVDDRMDFMKSSRAAIRYLQDLHAMFGDWNTALAAYNCGQNRVLRTINRQRIKYMDSFWELYLQLPRETARYVPRFHAVQHILRNPEKYGFTDLPELDQPIQYDTTVTRRQMAIKDIAKKLRIPANELQELNPQLRSKITPRYAFTLRVPSGRAADAERIMPSVKTTKAPTLPMYVVHRVRSGQTLSHIARRYRSSVRAIMRANRIRDARRIRVGQRLRVPTRLSRSQRRTYHKTTSGKVIPAKSGTVYVIKPGDTLWNIAQAHGLTVMQLRRLNGLSRSSRIYPGHRLTVAK
jgi:membrane-bound lytic murein transglycosylase D